MNVIVTAEETFKTKGNYSNKTSFYCFSAEFRTMEYSAYIIGHYSPRHTLTQIFVVPWMCKRENIYSLLDMVHSKSFLDCIC